MKTDDTAYLSITGIVLVTAFLMTLPLLAMQISDAMAWSPFDVALVGALLLGGGISFELISRKAKEVDYRVGAGVALGSAVLLVLANGAVGLIGAAGNGANIMYAGVLAVGTIGAFIARLEPRGMARALGATAVAHALVATIAIIGGLGSPASPPLEILGTNGIFVALWGGSAWLFWRAAEEQNPADTAASA